MSEIDNIEKTGHNDFHKYDYVKEEDITKHLRLLFVKHRVFLTSSVKSHSTSPMTVNNKQVLFTSVVMAYTFYDVDSAETLTLDAVGESLDNGDKALYKALTGAHKYFLLKNFNIPLGDDPEESSLDRTLNNQPVTGNAFNMTVKNQSSGVYRIPFGKHKGKELSQVTSHELKSYADWLAKQPSNDFNKEFFKQLDLFNSKEMDDIPL